MSQIRRWKSIAPDADEGGRVDPYRSMPADHYHRLFDSVHKKRKFGKGKKKVVVGGVKGEPFVDRSKLCREDDIF